MDKTRLIIVEGLPGTGKSTVAAMIAEALEQKGRRTVCLDEGERHHPADYESYDFPDFETERRLILEKWRAFVQSADRETTYVFNCLFLQNPMSETMMRFGLEQQASAEYIASIADIIKPMSPFIVYIDQPDAKASIDRVMSERGGDWLKMVMDYHLSQGYGKQNGLSGYEGYIECLAERRKRELKILRSLYIASDVVLPYMTADDLVKRLKVFIG